MNKGGLAPKLILSVEVEESIQNWSELHASEFSESIFKFPKKFWQGLVHPLHKDGFYLAFRSPVNSTDKFEIKHQQA